MPDAFSAAAAIATETLLKSLRLPPQDALAAWAAAEIRAGAPARIAMLAAAEAAGVELAKLCFVAKGDAREIGLIVASRAADSMRTEILRRLDAIKRSEAECADQPAACEL